MNRVLLGALCAPVIVAAAPAVAAADLVDTTITSADAQRRDCISKPASGAGVVQRAVTASANGLVRASLAAQGGDWDLGVFDSRTGKLVTGSASFGATEVAEGVAASGQPLILQACRRSGATNSARLTARSLPLPGPTREKIQLVRVNLPYPASRDALDATGVDRTEHARPGVQDVLAFGTADLAKLTQAGLTYRVITPDVVAADRAALTAAARTDVKPMPSGRTSYRRLPDFQADMKALVEQNPTLVKPVTLNHPTLEGRAVEGIEISTNVAAQDGKQPQ